MFRALRMLDGVRAHGGALRCREPAADDDAPRGDLTARTGGLASTGRPWTGRTGPKASDHHAGHHYPRCHAVLELLLSGLLGLNYVKTRRPQTVLSTTDDVQSRIAEYVNEVVALKISAKLVD